MAHMVLLRKKFSNIYSSDHLYIAFYLEKCSLADIAQLLEVTLYRSSLALKLY